MKVFIKGSMMWFAREIHERPVYVLFMPRESSKRLPALV